MRSAVEEVENDQVSNRVMTRSTSNQKKFMDDYANRRMTRSAFKQQQEQKGDEKPQQQQQKKRKRKNKKKKPVVDDTPKISWRHMRYFTPEEREAYQKKLKESEGFDVGKYTSEVALSNPISEISLEEHSEVSDFSTEAAKMAIRDYNRKKRTKYEFVKLVRVCIGLCTGWMYYITFQAKQDGMAPSPPRNFQARIHNFIGMHVQFCREEKKPQLTEGAWAQEMPFSCIAVRTHNKVTAISIVNLFWDLRGQRRLHVGAWLPRHAIADPELVASHYRCLALLLNPHRNRLPSAGGKTTNRAQTASASENNNETTMTHSKVAGKAWNNMSNAEKAPFMDMANQTKARTKKNVPKKKRTTALKTLEFGRIGVYTITLDNVGRALGLPLGTIPVPTECEDFHFKHIRNMFAEGDEELKRGVTFAMMQGVFESGVADAKFQTSYVLFVLSCLLCPTTKDVASTKFYPAVYDLTKTPTYAWPQFVLDWLVKEITKFKKRDAKVVDNKKDAPGVSGCVLLLMLIYFDKEPMGMNVGSVGVPLIQSWTTKLIMEQIAKEENLDLLNPISGQFPEPRLRHPGVYRAPNAIRKKLSLHALLIIGEYRTKSGVQIYDCQNSWGEDWGDEGFCKVYLHHLAHCRYTYARRPKVPLAPPQPTAPSSPPLGDPASTDPNSLPLALRKICVRTLMALKTSVPTTSQAFDPPGPGTLSLIDIRPDSSC
ncbi:hypothetical protein RHGRI_020302 [Rhododendron griersonianum]|uniref:HMG box domain-containing protein n=1 Tax=Rhododendron griersonianum TaxID=479676 RepID=A0AAV6JKV6_9ERIC|nr:hypothetical protein RHGRI_020302 [Rhododendron griersonianum]